MYPLTLTRLKYVFSFSFLWEKWKQILNNFYVILCSLFLVTFSKLYIIFNFYPLDSYIFQTWITRENRLFSYGYFCRFFFILEDLSFLILKIFIFGTMGNWRGLLPPHFGYLGNFFKKSVGDLIFYYASTYKIREKIFSKELSHLWTIMWPTSNQTLLWFLISTRMWQKWILLIRWNQIEWSVVTLLKQVANLC